MAAFSPRGKEKSDKPTFLKEGVRCIFCSKLFTDSTTLSEHVFFDHKAEREKARA